MGAMLEYLENFFEKYLTIPKIYITDVVEIIIIAFLVYFLIVWLRKSNAWFLVRGLVVLFVFMIIAAVFHLTTILWIANKALSAAIIALVVVFQPELRKALEKLGKRNTFSKFFRIGSNSDEDRFSDKTLNEIVQAVYSMAKVKTGALMLIKKDFDLGQYVETGISIDADISSELLLNIFEKNTPLHDGAVIIDGDRIVAATCYLPLSENTNISKDLGTRHRAGIGASEETDALVIIVSEETGEVAIANEGVLQRNLSSSDLKNELINIQEFD